MYNIRRKIRAEKVLASISEITYSTRNGWKIDRGSRELSTCWIVWQEMCVSNTSSNNIVTNYSSSFSICRLKMMLISTVWTFQSSKVVSFLRTIRIDLIVKSYALPSTVNTVRKDHQATVLWKMQITLARTFLTLNKISLRLLAPFQSATRVMSRVNRALLVNQSKDQDHKPTNNSRSSTSWRSSLTGSPTITEYSCKNNNRLRNFL